MTLTTSNTVPFFSTMQSFDCLRYKPGRKKNFQLLEPQLSPANYQYLLVHHLSSQSRTQSTSNETISTKIIGCQHCLKGAIAKLNCYSSIPKAIAEVSCTSPAFPIQCSQERTRSHLRNYASTVHNLKKRSARWGRSITGFGMKGAQLHQRSKYSITYNQLSTTNFM